MPLVKGQSSCGYVWLDISMVLSQAWSWKKTNQSSSKGSFCTSLFVLKVFTNRNRFSDYWKACRGGRCSWNSIGSWLLYDNRSKRFIHPNVCYPAAHLYAPHKEESADLYERTPSGVDDGLRHVIQVCISYVAFEAPMHDHHAIFFFGRYGRYDHF